MLVSDLKTRTARTGKFAFTAALLVTLLTAASIARSAPPQLLPKEAIRSATPMPTITAVVDCEERMQLHDAIAALREGDPQDAVELWRQLKLSKEHEIWRQVAITVSLMRSGEIDEAGAALRTAQQLDPENAVVHYLDGVWLAVQSYIMRANLGHDKGLSAVYEDAALARLREVREVAHRIPWGTRLGTATKVGDPGLPSVYELLAAVRMDRVVAKSHTAMAKIYLRQGFLGRAEVNLDEAATLGLNVAPLMRSLATHYEENGEHRSAARSLLKSMQHEAAKAGTIVKLLQAIRAAVVSE